MSGDPAVEAAKRAEEASGWWKSGYSTPWDSDYATDAAREALRPIRAWAELYDGQSREIDDLLDTLRPLIYPEDEL